MNNIDLYRLCTLKSALKLEILGMERRGQSVYSIIKEEFGLKGNKQRVFEQFSAKVEALEMMNELNQKESK